MIAPELRSKENAAETARAVEEVTRAGASGPRSAALLEVVRSVCVSTVSPHALQTPSARRALVDLLVVTACIETEVDAAKEERVIAHAERLEVVSPWVRALPSLRRRRVLPLKRALVSRSPDGRRVLSRTWSEDGVSGALGAAAFVLGLFRDPLLAKRFRALADLPDETLGRAFHDHLVSRGMTFPGERGGLPERMIHHDLMHVLNDYGTDPAGECELGAFYAGHCLAIDEPNWFTFFVTVLATFHLDLPVSPAIVTPARGAFDPKRALAAFERGLRVGTDVMGRWDYWSLMPLPLEAARAQLGLSLGDLANTTSRAGDDR